MATATVRPGPEAEGGEIWVVFANFGNRERVGRNGRVDGNLHPRRRRSTRRS
jgi:hypothetical protein